MSYIIYPFKKSIKKEYPENLLRNDLEISFKLGTPPQDVNLNLRSKVYTFFVSSSQVGLPYTFNENISKTLIKETQFPDSYMRQEYNKGYKIYESIIINEKEIKNVSLILATSLVYNESGALGLRLVDSHEYANDLSFIYQIKYNADLDNYAFSLRYDDDNSGELIIGSYPHLYNDKYKEDNFYYTKVGNIGNNVDWVLDFDSIEYDNKTIKLISTKCLVEIEYGLIKAPYNLKRSFNNIFNDKCKEEFYKEENISIIHCDENFDIINFKNITFLLKDIEYVFTLSYKDLFIKENNEYIFSIVFDNNTNNDFWILGKPFMKKYQLIYDLDRKIIGLYKDSNETEDNGREGFTIYIILLIVLFLMIIALVIYIIYFIKKPKRSRAFELDDDNFDYIPSN